MKNIKTVLCHGTFDILHEGHIEHLKTCSSYGDKLIVALSTDKMAGLRKGPGRPVNPFAQRKAVLEAVLRYVDEVIPAPDSTANLILNLMGLARTLRPDVFVTSYAAFDGLKQEFESEGTRLVIRTNRPLNSTTQIVRRIQDIEHN